MVHMEEVLKDELHTYVVTELLSGGELLEQIRRRTSFTEAEASFIMRQLSDAVQFIHSKVCPRSAEETSQFMSGYALQFGISRLLAKPYSLFIVGMLGP